MTSPLSPEAVAQMVADLTTEAQAARQAYRADVVASYTTEATPKLDDYDIFMGVLVVEAVSDMLTTLAAENAALRAERDAAQSELDDCLASDWPIWATQIYNTLKEFGYRYDHFDGIDLPEDVSEFLRGFPENAASELMEQRDDALQELATLRASEAAAWARVKVLEAALLKTRALVCEAAVVGFNYADGDWADRLYRNNGDMTAALTPTADKEPKT